MAIILDLKAKTETEWAPGKGPRNALECARILVDCAQLSKMVRKSQKECHEWVEATGEHVEHPDGTKHLKHSVTSREGKYSATLAEVTQLLLDCGATAKVCKLVAEKLRADGVGSPVKTSRYVWIKNEGSQSKSE